MSEFYVVDLRPAWASEPYLTMWRANDAGYAQSVPWAGLYSLEEITSGQRSYCKREGRRIVRMAVPAGVVMKLAAPRSLRDQSMALGLCSTTPRQSGMR